MAEKKNGLPGKRVSGLRRFLRKLENTSGQGIALVEREVAVDYEMGAVVKKMEGSDDRAVLFTKVRGYETPVLLNLYGCKSRIAMSLGLSADTSPIKTQEVFSSRLSNKGETRLSQNAEVHEIIQKGNKVDLASLPIGIHVAKQGGKYISSGVLLARDPLTGSINGGIYRLMVQGKDALSICVDSGHRSSTVGGRIWVFPSDRFQ